MNLHLHIFVQYTHTYIHTPTQDASRSGNKITLLRRDAAATSPA